MSVIFMIENLENGKKYIGYTSLDFEDRKNLDLYRLRESVFGNKELQSDFNKYGEDNIKFYLLDNKLSKQEAIERKDYFIRNLNTIKQGYNKSGTISNKNKQLFNGIEENVKDKDINSENRITKEEALYIYYVYHKTDITQKELAENYGLSETQISRIARGKRWAHIIRKLGLNTHSRKQKLLL